jgi:hypothetical protein
MPVAILFPCRKDTADGWSKCWSNLQVVDIPVQSPAPKVFSYDEEWLAVLRETHDMLALSSRPTRFPTAFNAAPEVAREHREAVAEALAESGGSEIPADAFVQTVDPSSVDTPKPTNRACVEASGKGLEPRGFRE